MREPKPRALQTHVDLSGTYSFKSIIQGERRSRASLYRALGSSDNVLERCRNRKLSHIASIKAKSNETHTLHMSAESAYSPTWYIQ
jgi:hypothetical protein